MAGDRRGHSDNSQNPPEPSLHRVASSRSCPLAGQRNRLAMSEAQAAQMYRKDGSRWVLCEHEALVLGSSVKKSSGLSFGTEE